MIHRRMALGDAARRMVGRLRPRWAWLAVAAAILIAHVWSTERLIQGSSFKIGKQRYYSLFDDGMISMRYAWNLAHGLGPVWNEGERVEGYSNPLWVLLMTLPSLVADKARAVLAVQWMGAAFFTGTVVLAGLLARRLAQRREGAAADLAGVIAAAGTAAYYPLAFWSVVGMEVSLVAFLAALLWFLCVDERPGRPRDWALRGGLAFLAYFTRPDAALPALLALLGYVALQPRRSLRDLAVMGAAFALPVAGHLLWRRSYYGVWSPNTYTLKLGGMPLDARLVDGWGFVQPFLLECWPLLVVIAVGVALARSWPAAAAASMLLVAFAYQIYVGGDPFPTWRQLTPAMPLAIAAASAGLAAVAGPILRPTWYRAAGVALLVAALFHANVPYWPQLASGQPEFTSANRQHTATALKLDQMLPADASLAVVWAGTIPYYAGRRAIDILGKCDRHIARLPPDRTGAISWRGMQSVPGHNKYDLEHSIRSVEPDYVQVTAWGRQNLGRWASRRYVPLGKRYAGLIRKDRAPTEQKRR